MVSRSDYFPLPNIVAGRSPSTDILDDLIGSFATEEILLAWRKLVVRSRKDFASAVKYEHCV